jgi:uncharacterized membrane protein YsdA (DUF1294 family)
MLALAVAVASLIGVAGLVITGRLPPWALLLYLTASIVAFFAYSLDKSAARRGNWRISESFLQSCALVGGWPGALVAQRWLRHKSSKATFQTTFWWMVVLNLTAVVVVVAASFDRW